MEWVDDMLRLVRSYRLQDPKYYSCRTGPNQMIKYRLKTHQTPT